MASIICILNASAGIAKAKLTDEALAKLFADQQLIVQVLTARGGSDLKALAQQAVHQRPDIIVACGGDGTLNCVAAEVIDNGIALAALPLGTFNHFCRDIGIPHKLEEAIAVIAAGYRRQIDVGDVNGRIFLNNSSLGIYPRLVRERNAMQRSGFSKSAGFFRALMFVLFHYKRLAVRLQNAGKPETVYRTPFIFIGNNAYQATGWNIGKRDALSGGFLWLYVARFSGASAMIRMAVKAMLGDSSTEKADAFETTHCRIEARKHWMHVSTDGEVNLMKMPLYFKTRPAALTVITPEPSMEQNVAFAALAWAVFAGAVNTLDFQLRDSLQGAANDSLTAAMNMITRLGSVMVLSMLAALAVAGFWFGKWQGATKQLGVTMAMAIFVENALKYAFHRMRPEPFFGLVAPESYSFPSGHTLFSTCFYGILVLIFIRRWHAHVVRGMIGLGAASLVLTIGFSRIYLGLHFPSDVVAGILAGFFCIAMVQIYLEQPER
eukprot:gene7692-7753_t